MKSSEEILDELVESISALSEVRSIGMSKSGFPLPKSGEGDIDIFIYCDMIPDKEKRRALLKLLDDRIKQCRVGVLEKGHWGDGDFGLINEVETWMMYFTADEAIAEVESILQGKHPDRLDNYYYPTGRCAMLKDITILYDKSGFLHELKKRLSEYPKNLADTLLKYHLDMLDDTEDLERAVMRRDILFYHFALDIAIDHFLQALFALNRSYFPSRKRTIELIGEFDIKPHDCEKRLLQVIRAGSVSESIDQSYGLWKDLVTELKQLLPESGA